MQDLLCKLKSMSSGEDFVSFSKKTIKTSKTIIGVKVPKLRKLAKELYDEMGYVDFQKQYENIFEISIIQGLLIAQIEDREKMRKKLDSYLKSIDSWAEVDIVIPSLKAIKKDEKDFEYFKALSKSDEEFISRAGIVGIKKFFIKTKDYEEILKAIYDVKCEKFYVLMAEAWLISEILIQNSQNAQKIMQKIIKNNQINSFVINKSIQKAIESYRLSKETKEELKKLKI